MKILPVFLITICVISTISEINCHHHHHHHHHHHYHPDDGDCIRFDKPCSRDSDCCSGNCAFSILWFQKYCRESEELWFVVRAALELFFHKEKVEICTYNNSTFSNDTIAERYDKLEMTTHDLKYPTNFTVIVEYKSKFIEVKVNKIGVTLNGSTIELTEKAAKLFNIKNGESVPCQIKIPHLTLMLLKDFVKYFCPYLIVYLLYTFS